MKLSRFKYLAFTNPGLEKTLGKEVQNIVPKASVESIFGSKGVEFRGTLEEGLKVVTHCRTLNLLKLQIGHPFAADNLKMFEKNTKKLNLSAFITPYSDLQITVKAFASELSHT